MKFSFLVTFDVPERELRENVSYAEHVRAFQVDVLHQIGKVVSDDCSRFVNVIAPGQEPFIGRPVISETLPTPFIGRPVISGTLPTLPFDTEAEICALRPSPAPRLLPSIATTSCVLGWFLVPGGFCGGLAGSRMTFSKGQRVETLFAGAWVPATVLFVWRCVDLETKRRMLLYDLQVEFAEGERRLLPRVAENEIRRRDARRGHRRVLRWHSVMRKLT